MRQTKQMKRRIERAMFEVVKNPLVEPEIIRIMKGQGVDPTKEAIPAISVGKAVSGWLGGMANNKFIQKRTTLCLQM